MFAALGELIELLRWGIPGDRSLTGHPTLLALAAEYTTTVRRLQRSFVGPDDLQAPEPVDEQQFAQAEQSADDYVSTFHRMQQRAVEASGESTREGDPDYGSYREWLPFHHRRVVFLDHLTTALGYRQDAATA